MTGDAIQYSLYSHVRYRYIIATAFRNTKGMQQHVYMVQRAKNMNATIISSKRELIKIYEENNQKEEDQRQKI